MAPEEPTGPAARTHAPRVALVDDDDALREMLRKSLKQAGYDVSAFASGDEALAVCREACPDVLISDLVMPGLNGQELASAIREQCPNTILMFMSGYSEDELRDLDIRQVIFLPKPVSPRQLRETIERLLAG